MSSIKDLKVKGSPFAATPGKRANRFAALKEDGAAEVRVGLEEKVSGPHGTYSSVTVRVEIKATCAQTSEAIDLAHGVLFDECTAALDKYMKPATQQLVAFLEARDAE